MSGNRFEDIEVQVLVDGAWLDGWLDCWQRRSDVWVGFVRYAAGPGENRLNWFEHGQIRRP